MTWNKAAMQWKNYRVPTVRTMHGPVGERPEGYDSKPRFERNSDHVSCISCGHVVGCSCSRCEHGVITDGRGQRCASCAGLKPTRVVMSWSEAKAYVEADERRRVRCVDKGSGSNIAYPMELLFGRDSGMWNQDDGETFVVADDAPQTRGDVVWAREMCGSGRGVRIVSCECSESCRAGNGDVGRDFGPRFDPPLAYWRNTGAVFELVEETP